MIERVQCIVVSTQGSLGLVQEGQLFSMLRAGVEFDETPTETAHRILCNALGRFVRFDSLVKLNAIFDEDETMEYTFALHVRQSATGASLVRGFQWLHPGYRAALEAMHPHLLGDGVASSYRRAVKTEPTKLA